MLKTSFEETFTFFFLVRLFTDDFAFQNWVCFDSQRNFKRFINATFHGRADTESESLEPEPNRKLVNNQTSHFNFQTISIFQT